MTDTPKTLMEAVRHFADPKVCFEHMLQAKWPLSNPTCPKCGSDRVGVIRSRSMLQCKEPKCRKQFSVKVDTIFEDSPLGLDKWFVAIWCIANAKNGISSYELSRALGVTQKTSWFMLHRVRMAMKNRSFRKLYGTVETDETFIGGKAKNMHKHKREKRIRGRGAVGKAIVQGLLERGGEVRTECVGSTDDETLARNVRRTFNSDRTSTAMPRRPMVGCRSITSTSGLTTFGTTSRATSTPTALRTSGVFSNARLAALTSRSLPSI